MRLNQDLMQLANQAANARYTVLWQESGVTIKPQARRKAGVVIRPNGTVTTIEKPHKVLATAEAARAHLGL